MTHKNTHQHEKLSQRDKELNRVRNQFLFWSTVVVTGLNGVLLMIFRPSAGLPTAEPSAAVSDTSLTGMMVGYLRATERQKPDIIQNLIRAALTTTLHDDPMLVDALKFLVEAYKTEPALSPEWGASFEGIVELGLHSPRLQTVAELELVRVFQDQNLRRLQVPTLQALHRIGSEVGANECMQILVNHKSMSLRRESLMLLGAYARDFRANPSRDSISQRIVQVMQRVAERDSVLRPVASLALARIGEKIPDSILAELLRADASWGEVRAGVEVIRLGRMLGHAPMLREVAARGHLPAETQRQVEAVLADFQPGIPVRAARSTAGKVRKK